MDKFFQDVAEHLREDEGCRLQPYLDTEGVWTVGHGHSLEQPISLQAAEQILQDDIEVAMHDLDRHKPWWRMLPRPARLVVVNMCFNLGWPRYKEFVKFWAALEAHNFRMAAAEMRDSRWFRQVGRRSERLYQLMESAQSSTQV